MSPVVLFEVTELLEDFVDTDVTAVGLAAVAWHWLVRLLGLYPLAVYHRAGLLSLWHRLRFLRLRERQLTEIQWQIIEACQWTLCLSCYNSAMCAQSTIIYLLTLICDNYILQLTSNKNILHSKCSWYINIKTMFKFKHVKTVNECMKTANEKPRARHFQEDMHVMLYKTSCTDRPCRKDILHGCTGETCGKGSNSLRAECGLQIVDVQIPLYWLVLFREKSTVRDFEWKVKIQK